jgi:hypothetical protein
MLKHLAVCALVLGLPSLAAADTMSDHSMKGASMKGHSAMKGSMAGSKDHMKGSMAGTKGHMAMKGETGAMKANHAMGTPKP